MTVEFLDPAQIESAVGDAFGMKRKPAPAPAAAPKPATAPATSTAGRSNIVISDQLLDSLRNVESGGDTFAINKKTKAMGPYQFMPDTVQMMHKQGIKFNPFDENEAREAARKLLTQMAQRHNGNIELALKDYGGFVTKDPTSYVQKVLGGTSSKPAAAAPTAAPAGKAPEGQLTMDDLMNPDAINAAVTDAFGEKPKPGKVASKVTGILRGSAALADTIYGVVPGVAGMATYAGARAVGQSPEEAAATQAKVSGAIEKPFGKAFGVTETPEYKGEASQQLMNFIGENVGKGAEWISKQTGMPKAEVEYYMNLGMTAAPFSKAVRTEVGLATQAAKQAGGKVVSAVADVTPTSVRNVVRATTEAIAPGTTKAPAKAPTLGVQGQPTVPGMPVPPQAVPPAGRASVGAAGVPDATIVRQALLSATPEFQQLYGNMPLDKVNMPTVMRHLEADSLDVPVRLTKGQGTGDIVQLSKEQNLRGSQTELAYRINEQNQLLLDNLRTRRERTAPDVFTTKTIDSSEALINEYKALDKTRNLAIDTKFTELRNKAGGDLPVDSPALLKNIDQQLSKELLLTDGQGISQYRELKTLADAGTMTFDQYLSMRRNLSRLSAEAKDGNVRQAARIMVQELDKLPLTNETAALKPIADEARGLARERFEALKKDPAYKAAVTDSVPADKFFNKFVINGVNKNINTMIDTLGRDSLGHQHIKAGTINYLSDQAGIVNDKGNFSQNNYNKAVENLDKVNNFGAIFDPESQLKLKTLGNVAAYTQFQPRGAFVNNSNSVVGYLANKAEQVGNVIGLGKYGIPIGTIARQKIKSSKEKRFAKEALEPGAGSTLDEISKKGK